MHPQHVHPAPQDPGGLDGAKCRRERSSERYRHLAEHITAMPVTDHLLDPVDELHDLDLAAQDGEERPLVALVRRVLAGGERDVRSGARQPLPLLLGKRAEDPDDLDVLGGDHGANAIDGVRASRAKPPTAALSGGA